MTRPVIDRMISLYGEGLTLTEVGRRVGVSRTTVAYHLKRAGLRIRTEEKARRGPDNPRWSATPSDNAGRLRTRARFTTPERCEKCGGDRRLHRHHKDRDPTNLSPSNIEWLCASCHITQHRQEERAAARGVFAALEHVDEWVRRFEAGEMVAQIARSTEYSPNTVRRWLKDRGVFIAYRPGVYAERTR